MLNVIPKIIQYYSIITELVYIFVYGPAKVRLQVWEFLAALKTHWWPSALWLGCCLFDTFPISILNFICLKDSM